VGDLLLSRPDDNPMGDVEAKCVEEVFVRSALIWHVHVGGHVIRSTAEHPFYVEGAGWVACQDLKIGDRLLSADGTTVTVEDLFDTGEYETVYNLRIQDYHTYFVGREEWGFSVWAHNACYQQVGVSNDLAQQALAYRKGLANPLTGRNVMVLEYVTEDGTLATKPFLSNGRGVHTERMIDEGTKVLRIFTERQPCRNCFNFIERAFPTAEVNYLFPYMNKATRMPTYAIQSFFGKIFGLVRS
jgi:intein/homing endonuclease